MKCSDIFDYLNKLYPLDLAVEWDNPGFLLGRPGSEVKNILVVLDITNAVIDYAIKNSVNLIVSHHPIVFAPEKKINETSLLGNYILKILENHISVISMHTNFDIAVGGMSDIAVEKLGLKNTKVLEVTAIKDGKEYGIGKIGDLQKSLSLDELIHLLKEAYSLKNIAVYGRENIKNDIKRIAVSPGSGKGMYKFALGNADVLITGDITHHDGLDAINEGMCIIDATHYGLEHVFIEKVSKDLKYFDNINILEFTDTNPVCFIL